jgi:hypothetical protein
METIEQIVVTMQADGQIKIATMGDGRTLGTNYGSASQSMLMMEVLVKMLRPPK